MSLRIKQVEAMTAIQSTPNADLKTDIPLFDQDYQRGQSGDAVRIIQEWLRLHRIRVAIDGEFGSATEAAVRMFQKLNQLVVDGVVGPKTYAALVRPMVNALQPIAPQGRSLNEMVVAYALQHLKEFPREVGGQNRGPWVRLYMQGSEGSGWPWCVGFVGFVLRQAAQSLNISVPLKTSFSCDRMAVNAQTNRLFIPGEQAEDKSRIAPGSLFLIRGKQAGDWVHTGIVVQTYPDLMLTVEGNTNGDGSREGSEVWHIIRHYNQVDFIMLEPKGLTEAEVAGDSVS
ncbi:MAG TPA: peptidoglycan-binding domain-containing protein [Bacillota bacterium]|nr:peptidoglycan-binding domain-containing protein [Bacillota bacterium]